MMQCQRKCTIAYLIAIPRHLLRCRNAFSIQIALPFKALGAISNNEIEMVRLLREDANQIMEQLAQWNIALQDTSLAKKK